MAVEPSSLDCAILRRSICVNGREQAEEEKETLHDDR